MKNLVKKIMAITLICLMGFGLGASAITEAAERPSDKHHEQRYEHRDNDREHRMQEERNRHEREMRQREQEERARAERERKDREGENRKEALRALGGLALLAIILNNI